MAKTSYYLILNQYLENGIEITTKVTTMIGSADALSIDTKVNDLELL